MYSEFSESMPQHLQRSLTDVELRQVIDRLSRKIDYLYRTFGVPALDDDLPGYVMEARELILLDRDAEAVKVVREHTAVGIVEARAIVEDMRVRLRRSPVKLPEGAPVDGPVSPPLKAETLFGAIPATPVTEPVRSGPPSLSSLISARAEAEKIEAAVPVPRLSADEIWADDTPAPALVS
jgi:hypothetical protein